MKHTSLNETTRLYILHAEFVRIMRWLSYPRREGTQWILYFLEAINHRFNLKINNNVKYLIICWWVDLVINILNKKKTYASSRASGTFIIFSLKFFITMYVWVIFNFFIFTRFLRQLYMRAFCSPIQNTLWQQHQ